MLPRITWMPCARASSAIDMMLSLKSCARVGPVLPGDVVCSGEDVNDRRLERDHVCAEAHEHLWSGLAADAAIDDSAFKELGVGERPILGDRVAHEHEA